MDNVVDNVNDAASMLLLLLSVVAVWTSRYGQEPLKSLLSELAPLFIFGFLFSVIIGVLRVD
jgi:uncharacterized membrane protein YadS